MMRSKAGSLMLGLVMLAGCGGSSSGTDYTILQDSCEALVAAETNVSPSDVKAISTREGPHGTITTLEVAGAAAPWHCGADASGVIIGVEFSEAS